MSMLMRSSCVVREFPIAEREYRVAARECWEESVLPPASERRTAPSRRKRRRRQPRLLPVLLALSLVFSFLLGRASAIQTRADWLAGKVAARSQNSEENPPENGGGQAAAAAGTPVAVVPVPGEQTVDPATVSVPDPVVVSAPETAWNLMLVNWENPLPEDFTVPELTQMANGHAIDSRAYPALQAMMDAARAEGLQPTICSSFRTQQTQERLFRNKIQRLQNAGYSREDAEREAARWVARPGTSEHQAGLAVDIVDRSYQVLDHRQETTAVQQWLMVHCAEYGFILRYPSDKSELTGVGYEPWHYRYVGTEAAQAIMERGICLEEYLEIAG